MDVNRRSFYYWRKNLNNPSNKIMKRNADILLFKKYHELYPSHGYKWLRAIIEKEEGIVFSVNYAHRCCKYAGIRSKAKKIKIRRKYDREYVYPNLLTADLKIDRPMQVVVSDMTAFWCKNTFYELTLYMDLFNNEIIAYDISSKRGDRTTYINGLDQLLEKKKEYRNLQLILHTDQGSVYSSKSYNELLPLYNIIHSMSRAGTPTDNASMEAINGWIKEELFTDFKINNLDDPVKSIDEYIYFFNNKRPAYSLNYMTPIQYKIYMLNEQKILTSANN